MFNLASFSGESGRGYFSFIPVMHCEIYMYIVHILYCTAVIAMFNMYVCCTGAFDGAAVMTGKLNGVQARLNINCL